MYRGYDRVKFKLDEKKRRYQSFRLLSKFKFRKEKGALLSVYISKNIKF